MIGPAKALGRERAEVIVSASGDRALGGGLRVLFDENVGERVAGPQFRELSMGMTRASSSAPRARVGPALLESVELPAEPAAGEKLRACRNAPFPARGSEQNHERSFLRTENVFARTCSLMSFRSSPNLRPPVWSASAQPAVRSCRNGANVLHCPCEAGTAALGPCSNRRSHSGSSANCPGVRRWSAFSEPTVNGQSLPA